MTRVERTRWTRLPKAYLVGRLKNTLDWPKWSPMDHAQIVHPGNDGPSSPGEIRLFIVGKTVGREQVLPNVRGTVLRYQLLAGLPMRDYVGEVAIEDLGTWRKVTWRSSFHPAVPLTGWIFAIGMGGFFERLLDGLIGEADSEVTEIGRVA